MSFTSSSCDAPLVISDVGDPNSGVDSGSISPDSLVQSPTTSTPSTVGLSRTFFDFEFFPGDSSFFPPISSNIEKRASIWKDFSWESTHPAQKDCQTG